MAATLDSGGAESQTASIYLVLNIAQPIEIDRLESRRWAHRWFDEFSTGKASSLAEISCPPGLAVRYVGRLIRIGFPGAGSLIFPILPVVPPIRK
jgi:hypothetical protein